MGGLRGQRAVGWGLGRAAKGGGLVGWDCREAPAGQLGPKVAKVSPPALFEDHKPLTNLLFPGAPDSRHSLMEPVDGFPVGGWGCLESLEERSVGRGRSSEEGGRSEGDGLRKGCSGP